MSKIFLEDVKIYAYHGVLPEENIIGTYYIVNAEIHTDLWEAAVSDDLNDTISYADINEIIHDEMKIQSKLLEHVAGRIIAKINEKFDQISYIKLRITKTSPPMKGEMKGASIELEKSFLLGGIKGNE
ncbi:dihydroneopterin aldolase [Chryseobacterium wangxinyae]|uniref:dihydroneopterin aldolase n=1 Tax=Chryseobacterium sp. CY350 TaxID=2997336 RepID=UPI00227054BE|nr:dihydroneopterin aldolase [Chryseobacterium sp. CY350]MCY0978983.1 dihydroneopterin aldolase [Chryseobacterium sp. CY350]WBZ97289.1 dihydroneopterin aldolase [Chryseobacterium sp. CY350]